MTPDILRNVPRETIEKLEAYQALLETWQAHINLVGDIQAVWERHILDSAQIFPHLPSPDCRLADLGSGAGFPGLILAILGARRVHLIESDQRKAAFLREAARICDVPVSVHAERIETVREKDFEIVTARALAALPDLLEMAFPLLTPEGICLFPKGQNYLIEKKQAREAWAFDMDILPNRMHSTGVILRIGRLRALSPHRARTAQGESA